jgi:hypothetical protein
MKLFQMDVQAQHLMIVRQLRVNTLHIQTRRVMATAQ